MSNNDKSKTSKTARVMNLLSKKPASAPEQAESGAAPAEAVPAQTKPAGPASPILGTIGADASTSNQIRSALEDALAAELNPAPARPPEPPVQTRAEPVQVQQSEPEPAPAQPQPRLEETQPAPAEPAVAQPAAEQPSYINVMQVLVEEKAEKYVKMFGLCTCKRCLEDVKALTLNHLPPKYVVMAENEMIPKLTFYEGKYTSDVTAQLLKACSQVAERPHHTRE